MAQTLEVLKNRTSVCELCNSDSVLQVYDVPHSPSAVAEDSVLVCGTCKSQLDSSHYKPSHWRCLNNSMWSTVPAVQVVVYRMLHRLRDEGWPLDLLEMMYLEDDTRAWALEAIEAERDKLVHKDSNGHILEAGDSVVLIKDLNVKGAGFTAKRGTAVRNITLVHDNAGQIEGKVESQRIVILTEFVKKVG